MHTILQFCAILDFGDLKLIPQKVYQKIFGAQTPKKREKISKCGQCKHRMGARTGGCQNRVCAIHINGEDASACLMPPPLEVRPAAWGGRPSPCASRASMKRTRLRDSTATDRVAARRGACGAAGRSMGRRPAEVRDGRLARGSRGHTGRALWSQRRGRKPSASPEIFPAGQGS